MPSAVPLALLSDTDTCRTIALTALQLGTVAMMIRAGRSCMTATRFLKQLLLNWVQLVGVGLGVDGFLLPTSLAREGSSQKPRLLGVRLAVMVLLFIATIAIASAVLTLLMMTSAVFFERYAVPASSNAARMALFVLSTAVVVEVGCQAHIHLPGVDSVPLFAVVAVRRASLVVFC